MLHSRAISTNGTNNKLKTNLVNVSKFDLDLDDEMSATKFFKSGICVFVRALTWSSIDCEWWSTTKEWCSRCWETSMNLNRVRFWSLDWFDVSIGERIGGWFNKSNSDRNPVIVINEALCKFENWDQMALACLWNEYKLCFLHFYWCKSSYWNWI